jgi:hypothetical protein
MCWFLKMNPLNAGCLICWLLLLIMDVMPSGDLLATILSVLNFLFTHEISSQLAQLNCMTFYLLQMLLFLYFDRLSLFSITCPYSLSLTLSWPAGHMCPTYKESFQVHCDNSIPLFLHAVIYLEVSLFRWTSQNAFSRETAVYKWYCVQVSFVHGCFAGKCILTGSTE